MKMESSTKTWSIRGIATAAAQLTRTNLDPVTVFNWTHRGILQPARKGKRYLYSVDDLFVLLIRARLIEEGVSPIRTVEAMREIRRIAPDLLDPKKAATHRLIVLGRRAILVEHNGLAAEIGEHPRQSVLVLDASREITTARKAAA